jgi:hypothetical protein
MALHTHTTTGSLAANTTTPTPYQRPDQGDHQIYQMFKLLYYQAGSSKIELVLFAGSEDHTRLCAPPQGEQGGQLLK